MPTQPFGADAAFVGRADRCKVASARASEGSWSVAQRHRIIEVGYGKDSDFPQYAALHTDSSFLRLNYGPRSSWGTSIALLPSFWSGSFYHQGSHITVGWRDDTPDLVMSFNGSIGTLQVHGQIRLRPPGVDSIAGIVMVEVDGDVHLDYRPGEAFKPVVLSSMHISADYWDAKSAQVGSQSIQFPDRGWLIETPAFGRRLVLKGGSSAWKANAPTIELATNRVWDLAGWKTHSFDPDDDNLSLWAASDRVPRSWDYAFFAKP